MTTTCLAMAGTRASGKTVYVAVAAGLLVLWGKRNNLSIGHYDEVSRLNFEKRYGRLEARSRMFDSTEPEIPGAKVRQAHQEPVLLRIRKPGQRDHVLVLRDVAGENLQDPAMSPAHFRFLATADGMILMIDPSESGELRQALAGSVALPESTFDPAAVWGNLDALQNAVIGASAQMVPIAVTISKFDLVHRAAQNPGSRLSAALSARGSRMHQDPSLRVGGIDEVDARLLDQELRSLLGYLDQSMVVTKADVYARRGPVRMFAVSAMGHAPSAGRVAAHGTIPFRCTDPIKWFLQRAEVL